MTGLINEHNMISQGPRSPMPQKPKKPVEPVMMADGESFTEGLEPLANIPAKAGEDLEAQIIDSKLDYNKIGTLLTEARSSGSLESCPATLSLCRTFDRLISAGHLSESSHASAKQVVVIQWLKRKLYEFRSLLLHFVQHAADDQAKTALDLMMHLLKKEASGFIKNESAIWTKGRFSHIIQTLVEANSASKQLYFGRAYTRRFIDVRLLTYKALKDITSRRSHAHRLDNIIFFLAELEDQESPSSARTFIENDELAVLKVSNPLSNTKIKEASDAWLSILKYDLTRMQRKTLLELLPNTIAPRVHRAEALMDFLTDSFNMEGSISLLALSGLFHLIQNNNLDYPQFYERLYSLLDASILHSKNRSGFFRLLDQCLSSTHLPAALVASFIKRLSRLCLFAPASAIAVIVPLIYNLLKTHPPCTFMIHRPAGTHHPNDSNPEICSFQMAEGDPMVTGAIDSSLWELEALQSHYHPIIATLCKMISEQFTKPSYNLEDFLDHSYTSMLESEFAKETRALPIVEHQIPKRIFTKAEESTCSILVDLWKFDR